MTVTNIDPKNIKIVAFDLDGTLTQHKTSLDEKNKSVLNRLQITDKAYLVSEIGFVSNLNGVILDPIFYLMLY